MELSPNFKSKIYHLPEGQISYDDSGETITYNGKDSKQRPIVICIPGGGDTREQYRYLAPLLHQGGFRVICTDLRGMGNSSTKWKSCRPEDVANDIEYLVEHLRIMMKRGCSIIAHAESAIVALLLASKRLDVIRSISLISPVVLERNKSSNEIAKIKYDSKMPWKVSFWKKYYKSLYAYDEEFLPSDHDYYYGAVVHMMKEPKRYSLYYDFVTAPLPLTFIAKFSSIRCPVYMAGNNNLNTNEEIEYIKNQLRYNVPLIQSKDYDCGRFIHLVQYNDLSKDLSNWIGNNSGPLWKIDINYELLKYSYLSKVPKPIRMRAGQDRVKKNKMVIRYIGNVAE